MYYDMGAMYGDRRATYCEMGAMHYDMGAITIIILIHMLTSHVIMHAYTLTLLIV